MIDSVGLTKYNIVFKITNSMRLGDSMRNHTIISILIR